VRIEKKRLASTASFFLNFNKNKKYDKILFMNDKNEIKKSLTSIEEERVLEK